MGAVVAWRVRVDAARTHTVQLGDTLLAQLFFTGRHLESLQAGKVRRSQPILALANESHQMPVLFLQLNSGYRLGETIRVSAYATTPQIPSLGNIRLICTSVWDEGEDTRTRELGRFYQQLAFQGVVAPAIHRFSAEWQVPLRATPSRNEKGDKILWRLAVLV